MKTLPPRLPSAWVTVTEEPAAHPLALDESPRDVCKGGNLSVDIFDFVFLMHRRMDDTAFGRLVHCGGIFAQLGAFGSACKNLVCVGKRGGRARPIGAGGTRNATSLYAQLSAAGRL